MVLLKVDRWVVSWGNELGCCSVVRLADTTDVHSVTQLADMKVFLLDSHWENSMVVDWAHWMAE